MARLLKIIGITLGTIIVLMVATIIFIVAFFDPNAYKPQISAAVRDVTGRELAIEGDIELSLFPWIGMELGEVRLSNAAGFGDTPFARIDGAEVKLRLLPLLRQQVETKAVVLRGLRLNLEVDEGGKTNWEDLGQSGADTTGRIPPATPQEPAPSQPRVSLAALAIGGVEISDARVNYDDRATEAHYSVEQLNLVTGSVTLDKPVDVSLNSRFSSNRTPLKGKLDLKTRIGFDLAAKQYRLDDLVLETTLEGSDLPNGSLQARLAADVTADLERQTASLSNLTVNAYELAASGRLDADRILAAPTFKG